MESHTIIHLIFFATATGRDRHSHCRCVYCDSTKNQWSEANHQQGNILTLSLLTDYALQHQCNTQHHKFAKIDTKGCSKAKLKGVGNITPLHLGEQSNETVN